ncbi:MAG: EAL domain-containing protein [Sulfurimonas sp.]|uniref:EAL domain-containing protein n=1 Tax=Sulfurimonas sp. TaxID=2022749 RepID=UPI00261045FB|nr:EAL domain-containing protein [Sulfurimonas sp.]MDD5373704.1 EAL domain-containing protein [Sulfurimonas sp.]
MNFYAKANFITLIFLLLSWVIIYVVFDYQFKNSRQQQFEQIVSGVHNLFEIKVQEKQKSLSFQLDQMLNIENLAEAIFSKEYEKIKSIIDPYYRDLKISNEDINILTFRTKENVTLYRAHKPEFYGDKLNQKRKIIIDTNNLKRSFSGFEVGNLEITYRVTKPIFYKGNYVGNVEIGLNPRNILKDLNSVFEIDIGVAASNSFLDVMLNKSIVYIGDKHFLVSGNEALKNYFSKYDKNFDIYKVDTSITLKNHLAEKFGFLVVGFDISQSIEKSRELMNRLFILTIIVMSVFSIILFLCFNKALKYFKDKVYVEQFTELSEGYEVNKRIIENAIKKNRVVPYFQPIVDADGKIIKYEALMRIVDLQKNQQKVLFPYEFLNESIKSELYISILRDMIRKSLHFFSNRNEKISINFLPDDLFNLIIMNEFIEDIKKFDSPQRVVVEVTERQSVENFSKLLQLVKKLRKLGVLISIDNFDNSYANNVHILEIKPDYIKIKGFLMQNILTDDNSKNLVKNIVKFAKELNIKTVAEFVENKETFELLKKYGVDEFQGYYFGYPTDLINS